MWLTGKLESTKHSHLKLFQLYGFRTDYSLITVGKLSRLHTSKFSLTSVIDNVQMLMCMNDKFSSTSFSLTSFICWCERINKFSLTSFRCSQQYNYTADENRNNANFVFWSWLSLIWREKKGCWLVVLVVLYLCNMSTRRDIWIGHCGFALGQRKDEVSLKVLQAI